MINCVPFNFPHPAGRVNTVYAMPCPAVLAVMDAESVDLIVTSPPYAEKRKDT
jgi:DNA modification methylase